MTKTKFDSKLIRDYVLDHFSEDIIDSLKENKMPNLIGMNLSDALHLLYQFGFSTEVNGYGKIIYCLDATDKKINVGQKITKGSLIKIQLG